MPVYVHVGYSGYFKSGLMVYIRHCVMRLSSMEGLIFSSARFLAEVVIMKCILKSLAVAVCLSCIVGCASPYSNDSDFCLVDGRVVHVVNGDYRIVDGGLYVGNCFVSSSGLSFEFDNVLTVHDGEVYLDYYSF